MIETTNNIIFYIGYGIAILTMIAIILSFCWYIYKFPYMFRIYRRHLVAKASINILKRAIPREVDYFIEELRKENRKVYKDQANI